MLAIQSSSGRGGMERPEELSLFRGSPNEWHFSQLQAA